MGATQKIEHAQAKAAFEGFVSANDAAAAQSVFEAHYAYVEEAVLMANEAAQGQRQADQESYAQWIEHMSQHAPSIGVIVNDSDDMLEFHSLEFASHEDMGARKEALRALLQEHQGVPTGIKPSHLEDSDLPLEPIIYLNNPALVAMAAEAALSEASLLDVAYSG